MTHGDGAEGQTWARDRGLISERDDGGWLRDVGTSDVLCRESQNDRGRTETSALTHRCAC